MSDRHARLRLLVALSQALSLGALAAAVTPLFLGAPAPLGLTVVIIALSTALGFGTAVWPRGARAPADEVRLRAALVAGLWAALTALLMFVSHLPVALVVVWAVVGFTAALAAAGAGRIESEDSARALSARSALAALTGGVMGAVLGHGLVPGPAALALVALLVAGIVHALARAHYQAVDPDRVGRSAASVVTVIALVAVLLAIGPVHQAVGFVLGLIWTGMSYVLAAAVLIASYALWLFFRLLLLLVPLHARKTSPPAEHVAETRTPPVSLVHPSPLLLHVGPFLALLVAGAIAVWLAGRFRRSRAAPDAGLFRDEILGPGALGQRRRGLGRRGPPADGLARAYAQALAVLATAQDARAHPRAADTPRLVAKRAEEALEPGSEALLGFLRLSAAYADWHYGRGRNVVPDTLRGLLRLLRQALPIARRGGPRPPA